VNGALPDLERPVLDRAAASCFHVANGQTGTPDMAPAVAERGSTWPWAVKAGVPIAVRIALLAGKLRGKSPVW